MPCGSGDVVVMEGAGLQVTESGPTLADAKELSVTLRITFVELAVHCPAI